MSGFFSNRVKLPVHLFQLALIVGVLVVSVVRMLNQPKNAPRGRSTTMALGMAAKSLIIILYEILSAHVRAFKKWSSLKAYVILNALEIVFWGAVVFMMIQANIKFCEGMSCTLSWIVVVMGIVMSSLAFYMTIVTWLDFRHFRTYGTHRGHRYHGKHLEVQSSESITMDTAPMTGRHPGDQGQERLDIPKPVQVQADYAYYSPNARHETNHYHHSDGRHHSNGHHHHHSGGHHHSNGRY